MKASYIFEGDCTVEDIQIANTLALAQSVGVQELFSQLKIGSQLPFQHNVDATG